MRTSDTFNMYTMLSVIRCGQNSLCSSRGGALETTTGCSKVDQLKFTDLLHMQSMYVKLCNPESPIRKRLSSDNTFCDFLRSSTSKRRCLGI